MKELTKIKKVILASSALKGDDDKESVMYNQMDSRKQSTIQIN